MAVPHFGTLYEERESFKRVSKLTRTKLRALKAQKPLKGFEEEHQKDIIALENKLDFYIQRLDNISGKIQRLN